MPEVFEIKRAASDEGNLYVGASTDTGMPSAKGGSESLKGKRNFSKSGPGSWISVFSSSRKARMHCGWKGRDPSPFVESINCCRFASRNGKRLFINSGRAGWKNRSRIDLGFSACEGENAARILEAIPSGHASRKRTKTGTGARIG